LFFGRIEPELVDNKRFLLLGGHYGNDTRYYAVWDKNFKLTHYPQETSQGKRRSPREAGDCFSLQSGDS